MRGKTFQTTTEKEGKGAGCSLIIPLLPLPQGERGTTPEKNCLTVTAGGWTVRAADRHTRLKEIQLGEIGEGGIVVGAA